MNDTSPDPVTLAEQCVLGGLLLDNAARERINGLVAEHFALDRHRLIFHAITDTLDDGDAADLVTVYERLERNGAAERAGGLAYLNALAENTPSAANVATYAAKVEEAARHRAFAAKLAEARQALDRGDEETARAIINRALPEPKQLRKRLTARWADSLDVHLVGLYLIKNLMPSDSLIQIIGEPNCGKSAVVLDMACHIAMQMPYRGMRVRGGPVAYFSLEAPRSIENRLVAWCHHHGVSRASLMVVVISGSLDMRDPDSVAEAMALLRAEAKAHGSFALIVIDTQARAMPGANENAAEDMSALIAAADHLRTEAGATVGLVHHSGKDKARGGRGHSSQLGAVDVTLEVEDRQIKVGKVRDGDRGQPLGFDLLPVQLGHDEDGDPVTAVIAVALPVGVASAPRARKPPSGHAATAMRAFDDLVVDNAASTSPGTSSMPKGVRYLPLDVWRDRFARYYGVEPNETAGDANRRRNAWHDARKRLVAAGLISIDGGFAWKP